MHNIRNGVIRLQITDFLSKATVMFACASVTCTIATRKV